MAHDGFILLIEALENDEERHELIVTKRYLRDRSDPFSLPEPIFKSIYRLSRQLALDVIGELSPHMRESNRPELSIPNHLKILTAFHFYAHGGYQKSIAQDFISAMSQPSVSNCIVEVTQAINVNMHHEVKFPQTEDARNTEKQGFMNMHGGFPGIIGAIDCTHVAIAAPPVNHEQYPAILFLNRKGYYSLNVQIICNATLKILAINARYPGSVHDSAIWQTSMIKQEVIRNYNNGDRSSWLLGDSGYPLEPWLITPITGANLDEAEATFNRAHKSVRNVIERLNGVLKMRFRCLLKHRVLHYNPAMAANITNACAILHNRCVDRNEINLEEMEADENIIPGNNIIINNNWLNAGRNTRNRIVNTYFRD